MHKIMVVGCGLFGSAATRHLSERTDGVVCIGPKEPKNRQDHNGVFASHYDEGRMTVSYTHLTLPTKRIV